MRTIRIYQKGLYQEGEQLTLEAAQSHHVASVLRMQKEQYLTVFPGNNIEFHAQIIDIKKKSVIVKLLSAQTVNRESPRAIHLAQAISKGDKMEWVVQKAVELGVASITPIYTSRSVVKLDKERLQKKQQQWQAIAIAACEQSGRNTIPEIKEAMSINCLLANKPTAHCFILDPYEGNSCKTTHFDQGDLLLLIGPEGGFSPEEVKQAKQAQFQSLSLGPRILRTETAAITALSLLQAFCGDL